jgi:hypothetical protein
MSEMLTIREALLDVAAEIESGGLLPGRCLYFTFERGDSNVPTVPCCTIGHVAHRAGRGASAVERFHPSIRDVADANDSGDWPRVVKLLREAAEDGPALP